MEWYEIIIEILGGLTMVVPLIVALVKYISKAIKEKNWQALLKLVTNLMAEAEKKFTNGVERREWVLTCVKASADTLNYDINLEEVGKLIDSLCALSKIVNAPKCDEVVVEEVQE